MAYWQLYKMQKQQGFHLQKSNGAKSGRRCVLFERWLYNLIIEYLLLGFLVVFPDWAREVLSELYDHNWHFALSALGAKLQSLNTKYLSDMNELYIMLTHRSNQVLSFCTFTVLWQSLWGCHNFSILLSIKFMMQKAPSKLCTSSEGSLL